jgi:hypothetical protein
MAAMQLGSGYSAIVMTPQGLIAADRTGLLSHFDQGMPETVGFRESGFLKRQVSSLSPFGDAGLLALVDGELHLKKGDSSAWIAAHPEAPELRESLRLKGAKAWVDGERFWIFAPGFGVYSWIGDGKSWQRYLVSDRGHRDIDSILEASNGTLVARQGDDLIELYPSRAGGRLSIRVLQSEMFTRSFRALGLAPHLHSTLVVAARCEDALR